MHPNTNPKSKLLLNTMKIGTGIHASNPNSLFAPKIQFMGSSPRFCSSNNLKMTTKSSSNSGNVSCAPKWMELQGIKNWDGLLDPLDDALRDEILRYGQFVEAAYHRCFDTTPAYHRVTRCLHATCGVHLPAWADRWASARSSCIGYVAVCDDRAEIARLGRRDVVIAYRGTATPMEWAENLRVTLAGLPASMSRNDEKNKKSMVQSGLLSLYTSTDGTRASLQESIRDEVGKILVEYGDEPLSITVTGHSLGAALATITAHDISTAFEHAPLVTVVSFGGPRVGNKYFRRQLERGGTKVLRIVNSDDPVTKVPGFVVNVEGGMGMVRWMEEREWWVYAEIGKELRLSSRDCPDLSKGGVATCHDLKTYLHLVDHFVSSNCPLRATAKRVLCRTKQQQVLC